MSKRLHRQLEAAVDLAEQRAGRHTAAVEHQRGQRVRRHHMDVRAGVQARRALASTMKALMPRLPPCGSVLANTQ
jgi:hypothetical protein